MTSSNLSALFSLCLLSTAVAACGSVKAPASDAAFSDAAGNDSDAAPIPCTADTTVCVDDQIVVCNSAGEVEETTACALGCFDDERCSKLAPSNGLAQHLDDAATSVDVILVGSATINTTSATISDQNGSLALPTVTLSGGPVDILVVKVKSLVATDIQVTGTKALAIVSDGDILINGTINLSGVQDSNGPGAHVADVACQGKQGAGSAGTWSGGGGAGFGTMGGNGGGVNGFSGGSGGGVSGTAELVPLRGGCAGGNGGSGTIDTEPERADPGGGGGAIQMVSNTKITFGESGAIAANGGGGKGWTGGPIGCIINTQCFPGEGAGSDGGILLEAPEVDVTGGLGLFANGGGGMCGFGNSGQDGQLSGTNALGGDCSANTSYGSGGDGGALVGQNGAAGASGAGNNGHGGGGGGGAGRIRVNLPVGATFAIDGTVVSPAASTGSLTLR